MLALDIENPDNGFSARQTIAIADDGMSLFSHPGRVMKVNPLTGAVLWQRDDPEDATSSELLSATSEAGTFQQSTSWDTAAPITTITQRDRNGVVVAAATLPGDFDSYPPVLIGNLFVVQSPNTSAFSAIAIDLSGSSGLRYPTAVGSASQTRSVNPLFGTFEVRCRHVDDWRLILFPVYHCGMRVTDETATSRYLHGGPGGKDHCPGLKPTDTERFLCAWKSDEDTDGFNQSSLYYYSDHMDFDTIDGLIDSTVRWQNLSTHPKYNAVLGPNSNTWLRNTLHEQGIDELGIWVLTDWGPNLNVTTIQPQP